jgi:phosphoribosylformylglycinamidine synthase subunit PurL
VVGHVTDTGRVVVKMDGKVYADLPAAPLAEGLRYERPMQRPAYLDALHAFDPKTLPAPADLTAAFLAVISSPNVASKDWVFRQYDHNVRHGTVIRPGAADAGVVRVTAQDGKKVKGVAVSTGCNSRFCWIDPYEGARHAIVEAAANVSAVGAEPIGATDCLNFGNPEKPEIMWQFAEAVRGLGDACTALGIPIVSGNVSLYNETDGRAIFPTPMIGMVGLIKDARHAIGQAFRQPGDVVALIGRNTPELGGSEYMKVVHGKIAGKLPELDVEACGFSCAAVRALAEEGLIRSAHDLSEGGLAAGLAECCVSGAEPIGVAAMIAANELEPHEVLFGEAPGRFLISFAPEREAKVRDLAMRKYATYTIVGTVGGDRFTVRTGNDEIDLPLGDVVAAWRDGFRRVAE